MRHRFRATTPTFIAAGALAVAVLTGCGGKSTDSAAPSTAASAVTTVAPATTAAASPFCAKLNTAMDGITALGSGAGTSNKQAAASLFTQVATYLDGIVADAADGLGPALATIAASFRKASTVVGQQGGATENVFADPSYVAAAKQFVEYYTTKCQPSLGS